MNFKKDFLKRKSFIFVLIFLIIIGGLAMLYSPQSLLNSKLSIQELLPNSFLGTISASTIDKTDFLNTNPTSSLSLEKWYEIEDVIKTRQVHIYECVKDDKCIGDEFECPDICTIKEYKDEEYTVEQKRHFKVFTDYFYKKFPKHKRDIACRRRVDEAIQNMILDGVITVHENIPGKYRVLK